MIFLLIMGLIVIFAGVIISRRMKNDYKPEAVRSVLLIGIALGVVLMLASCFTSVPTGHTGIVTTFGRVENHTLNAGIHLTAPWQEVVKMDNRVQKARIELPCFSSDIQEVNIIYTLNYQINKQNAQELYRSVGQNYYDTVITPNVAECVKVAVAKYTAEDLVSGRSILAENVESLLVNALAQYNIEVASTSIEDIDFTDAFTNAVEAKQVAQQNLLRATTEQQQRTVEEEAAAERAVIAANADAETAKIKAQADLEVQKIQADANEYAGLKEAAKNKAINAQLTPELINYYYIQQWDGKLPTTYAGSENINAIIGLDN